MCGKILTFLVSVNVLLAKNKQTKKNCANWVKNKKKKSDGMKKKF
jgi:hypothetical protein